MKKKIALYMSGNFAQILKFLPEYLKEFEFISYNQNYKAHKLCFNNRFFSKSFYLYENFNKKYDKYKYTSIDNKINGFRVLATDKNHFKRIKSREQEKILNTMYNVFLEWIKYKKPDYIFIPIIETIDSMLLYEICLIKNITPICYCHARHLNTSFFSDSYLELLPNFYNKIKANSSQKNKAKSITKKLKKNIGNLNYNNVFHNMFESFENKEQISDLVQTNIFLRFFINVKLKIFDERKNQNLRLWIKFQVSIEKILIPIQRLIYSFFENLYIKPLKNLPNEFDYFPLHFSPESSINTPAPFYIDQLRVIDKILISRKSNRVLLVKEHPSMYLKRNFSFYNKLLKKPYLRIAQKSYDSIDLIKKAKTVYSVTGTACMESFYIGTKWQMLGENFLSEYINQNKNASPFDFSIDTLKVSGDFVLFSPPRKNNIRKKVLFAKQNLINMILKL